MLLPVAHIAGIPVEETLGMLAPAGTAMVGVLGANVRSRLRRLRGERRQRQAGSER